MKTSKLLAGVDEEMSRLQQVRALLFGGESVVDNGRKTGKKRVLSAEARARIAAAQRAR